MLCTLDLPGWDKSTAVAALDECGPVTSSHAPTTVGRTSLRAAWDPMRTKPERLRGSGLLGPDPDLRRRWPEPVRPSAPAPEQRGERTGGLHLRGGSGFAVQQRPGGHVTFNLVRLESSAAAHTLNVRFYDLGDATDPVGRNGAPAGLSDPVSRALAKARWRGLAVAPLTGLHRNHEGIATNGGRWQTIKIPIAQRLHVLGRRRPEQVLGTDRVERRPPARRTRPRGPPTSRATRSGWSSDGARSPG